MVECSHGNQTLAGHTTDVDARTSDDSAFRRIIPDHCRLHSKTVRLDCGRERRGALSYDYKFIPLRQQSPLQRIASEEVACVDPEVVVYNLQQRKYSLLIDGVNPRLSLATRCNQSTESQALEVVRDMSLLQT